MAIFNSYVTNYQRVYDCICIDYYLFIHMMKYKHYMYIYVNILKFYSV